MKINSSQTTNMIVLSTNKQPKTVLYFIKHYKILSSNPEGAFHDAAFNSSLLAFMILLLTSSRIAASRLSRSSFSRSSFSLSSSACWMELEMVFIASFPIRNEFARVK